MIPPLGSRNNALFDKALMTGSIVGAGQMTRERAERDLQELGESYGLYPDEVRKTVRSALDAALNVK